MTAWNWACTSTFVACVEPVLLVDLPEPVTSGAGEGVTGAVCAGGDDAWCEEPLRDPLALERVSRQRVPDAIADLDSFAPIEDRILVARPTVDGIPDETLLMAHAVRGGLRRLAQLLFADASPLERRRMYQRLVARARMLAASK